MKKMKCEAKEEGMRKVKDKMYGRSTEHNTVINSIKQVKKNRVNDASKDLIKVELNDDEIKIKANSGNFKVKIR